MTSADLTATLYNESDVDQALVAADMGATTPDQAMILAAEVLRLRDCFNEALDMWGDLDSAWAEVRGTKPQLMRHLGRA